MNEIIPILANFLVDFCPQKEDFYQMAGKDLVENVKLQRNPKFTFHSKSSNLIIGQFQNKHTRRVMELVSLDCQGKTMQEKCNL